MVQNIMRLGSRHMMLTRSLASLQEKDSGHTTDDGEQGRADAGSTGLRGDLSRRSGGGRRGRRNLGGGNGRLDDGGRRSRDHDGGGVLELGGGDQSGGGGLSRGLDGHGDGGVRSDSGSRGGGGALRGARGESDGLNTGVGGDNSGLAAGALTSLDVEGLGVLEDLGVALELEDKAVDGVGAEGGVDSPRVLLVGVGDTGCDELAMRIHTQRCAMRLGKRTGNVGDGDLGALVGAANQGDRDGAVSVLGGGRPGDLEGRAGRNLLVLAGGVDGVEVGGLGDSGDGHGQEGRGGSEEAHLDCC